MEDYAGAHTSRADDVWALFDMAAPRGIAIVHLGGIAVECRLKAMVVSYHKLTKWGSHSAQRKSPMCGAPVERPSHSLPSILRVIPPLYKKALADGQFLKHLGRLMHPLGATDFTFIDLRYSCSNLDSQTLAQWRASFAYVLGWLKKNEVVLP